MTRDEYIATEVRDEELIPSPENDPEEDRFAAEEQAQGHPKLVHCGRTMQVDRTNPARQYCSVIGCDFEVEVRPFGYAPGWTVHDLINGQAVEDRYWRVPAAPEGVVLLAG